MEIKILGSGCKKCKLLEANTQEALSILGVEANVVKVTDFQAIAAYQVMATPALVVDEKVVSFGKVLKPQKIADLLKSK